MYQHPPIDNVAAIYHVDTPNATENGAKAIETVVEAIEVYMQAFMQKFKGKEVHRHRKRSLQMFLQFLTERGHSLKVKDITLTHGQDFSDGLTNHFNGTPLTATQKPKYRNAFRSFSRFLHQAEVMEENIFLTVKKH